MESYIIIMKEHVATLKQIVMTRGLLQLGNILESDLTLSNEYCKVLEQCIFDDESLDKLLDIKDVPSNDDLRRAELILKEPSKSTDDELVC
jgi:hypothetical protein